MGRKGNQYVESNIAKFVYDVAVDITTTNTSVSLGTLPDNAIIIGGFYHVITTFSDTDDTDDTTVALGYTGATTAFFAATACGSYIGGLMECIDPGNRAEDGNPLTKTEIAATVADSYLLLDGNKEVLLTIGDDLALDAGKLVLWIDYVISE